MAAEARCPCGRPLHYVSPVVRAYVERMVAELGPTIQVHVSGHGAYLVPRHYLALHGLRAWQLPAIAARLGFEQVP